MPEEEAPSLLAILRRCADQAPAPWYPSVYARETGITRDSLDPALERLRMAGLIELTEWVSAEVGQGYRLTAVGQQVLSNPRDVRELEQGHLPRHLRAWQAPTVASPERLTTYERGEIIRGALTEPVFPAATLTLLAVNLLVFGYGLMLAQGERLTQAYLYEPGTQGLWDLYLRLGALDGEELWRGQSWRLLTACFVHLGLMHLGVNLFSLYVVGPLVEQLWGRWRFLAIYLISGLGGSAAMLQAEPHSGGAGASGALWGILASCAAWALLNRQHLPGELIVHWLRRLLLVFLLNIGISLLPGISAAAHFGGGLWGLAAAGLLNYQRFACGWPRRLATLGVLLLPAVCLGLLAVQMRVDPRWRTVQARAFITSLLPWLDNELEDPLAFYRNHLQAAVLPRPERRNPAQVNQARQTVAEPRRRFAELHRTFQRCGPFTDPHLEAARQAGQELAIAAEEFYRLVDLLLTPNDNWQQITAALERQQADVEERQRAWNAHLLEWHRRLNASR